MTSRVLAPEGELGDIEAVPALIPFMLWAFPQLPALSSSALAQQQAIHVVIGPATQ